jgi:Ca2+-binding RTX toxin-like protein
MFIPDNNSSANGTIKVASGAFTDVAGNANTDGADSDNTVTIPKTTTNTPTDTPNNGTVPGTTLPGTTLPGTTVPGTTVPGTTVPGTNLSGTAKNDTLPGTSGDDVINAGDGNDVVTGSAGNDTIDGGTGVDTLSFAGNFAAFSVSQGANGAVKLTNSKFGTDSVTNVERFKFSDVHFANDLSGSAGNAAKVITAAFGKAYVPQFLAIGLTLADSGQNIEALCATVTANKLVESIAGDSSTNAYVSALFKNVVGRAPNILELNTFAGMLESGSISRLGLLELAATHSMVSDTVNALSVELVGIAYEPGF